MLPCKEELSARTVDWPFMLSARTVDWIFMLCTLNGKVTGKVRFEEFSLHKMKIVNRVSKGPIISEDMCGIFQLPKKYSVSLSLACRRLLIEFSRARTKIADLAKEARE